MRDVVLYETKFWKIILNGDQAYFGRCYISLKRGCDSLSNLTTQEWSDFHENVVKKLEEVFKGLFNATMFNWTCMMNDGYKSEVPKPHVHFHFRPRYKHNVEFEGEIFEDPEFAHHYDRARKRFISEDLLKKIRDKIASELE